MYVLNGPYVRNLSVTRQILVFSTQHLLLFRGMAASSTVTMDYSRFINAFSLRRQPSPIRELTKIFAASPPGTIFLAGGLPNSTTFPFQSANFALKDGVSFTLDGKALQDALQYLPTPGYAPLIAQLKELQNHVHGLPSNFWERNELVVTTGSQDGLCKALEMSMEEGGAILAQEPIYSGTMAILKPYKPRIIPIAQDEHGLIVEKLRAALAAEWTQGDANGRQKEVPKMLYLNATGANPTGVTIPTSHKREIYAIACEYNLIILEDDPYYFLHFEEKDPTSFLSMDTEGRVIRFDSFSKVLSSGLRLGFVTGPKPLLSCVELHMQASVLHASSLPQVLASTLLREWGPDKLKQHFKYIQSFYKDKRDYMLAAAERHLTGLAEWSVPTAGMFLWLRVPGVKDVRRMVSEGGPAKGVLLVPGHAFMVDEAAPCNFFRASFSIAAPQDVDQGFQRLAELIKDEMAAGTK